jgi:hypothetical protein
MHIRLVDTKAGTVKMSLTEPRKLAFESYSVHLTAKDPESLDNNNAECVMQS